MSWCVFITLLLLNDLLHTLQENGHSPVWIIRCFLRLLLWLNDLLHTPHSYGCSPLCILWCAFRTLLLLNDLLHISQLCECFVLGMCSWVFSTDSRTNASWHTSWSSWCMSWCSYIVYWSRIKKKYYINFEQGQWVWEQNKNEIIQWLLHYKGHVHINVWKRNMGMYAVSPTAAEMRVLGTHGINHNTEQKNKRENWNVYTLEHKSINNRLSWYGCILRLKKTVKIKVLKMTMTRKPEGWCKWIHKWLKCQRLFRHM